VPFETKGQVFLTMTHIESESVHIMIEEDDFELAIIDWSWFQSLHYRVTLLTDHCNNTWTQL